MPDKDTADAHKNEDTNTEPDKTTEQDTSDVTTESKKVTKKNQKFYKKPWFWGAAVLSLAGIGLAIFFAIFFSNQNSNKQAVSDGWHSIAGQVTALEGLAGVIQDQASFDKYNIELKKLNTSVADKKFNAQKLKYKSQDTENYVEFLDRYGNYTAESSRYADKIIDFTDSEADKLKDLSGIAKTSSEKLKSNAKFIVEAMPASAFEIQATLSEANKTILTGQLSVKSKQAAEQAQTAKEAADKKAAESTSGNYLNAFLAGNAALIRQYMTEGYQREYDFNQLTAESRTVIYPASFRILSSQMVDASKYKVQANVLFKQRDGSSQYTNGNELNIIYNAASAKWLVDSVKEGSSF